MYRQKGTGNARAGSKRSGIRRGGGHIMSIRPRDYSYRLPRKALRAATRMAIASKIQDGQMVIVDELAMGEPKTREMVGVLAALGLSGTSALLAIAEQDVNVYKSTRNIAGVSVSPASELNAYAVLAPSRMVVTKAALDSIVEGAKAVAATSEAE
jgi:large subunit ribosomal protein L4